MKNHILHLLTRTPLHVGAGSSVGVVDQPVQRERHTGFPIIPGSSVKGVLRDRFANGERDPAFGFADSAAPASGDEESASGQAGSLSFSEAKLLLFPVRSPKGGFALATCPLALARFARDAGLNEELPENPRSEQCLAGKDVQIGGGANASPSVVLEEYHFEVSGPFPAEWAERLAATFPNDPVLRGSLGRMVLLSDEDFCFFVQNTCPVQQHVRIDPESGTAEDGGLFNEEAVPSESLFYLVLTDFTRKTADQERVRAVLNELSAESLLQFGGNATTGLGFCSAQLQPADLS